MIDFSPKHDIYIYYDDDSLIPMDIPHYVSEKIADGTWMLSTSGDRHYLIAGEDEGIAIDTGYGAGNLREYLENLCGKPVKRVINTHFHFDHSALDPYFDKAYASAVDLPKLCRVEMYPSFNGLDFPRDFESEAVGDGSIIRVGGKELEIFEIGDHTPGGIAILDRETRILFMGDEFMVFGKMLNGSVSKWAADMEKLHNVRDSFDRIAGGFGITDAEFFDLFYEASQKIMAGERSEMPEIEKFDGPKIPVVEGHKVYHWQMPHPEDRPGSKPEDKKEGKVDPRGPAKSGMECFTYKGLRFIFKPE